MGSYTGERVRQFPRVKVRGPEPRAKHPVQRIASPNWSRWTEGFRRKKKIT